MPDDPNSSDNNYAGSNVNVLNTEIVNEMPVLEVNPGDANKYTFYKHRLVARFEIPRSAANGSSIEPFSFKNHICRVANELVEEFESAVAGLHKSDGLNIVRLMNIENERSVLGSRPIATRGATQSTDIPDSAKPSGARQEIASNPTSGLGTLRGLHGMRPISEAGAKVIDTTVADKT